MEDWGRRRLLAHDGYVVLRLRLSTIEEGGLKRGLSNGERAWWVLRSPDDSSNLERVRPQEGLDTDTAPIELVERRKALQPGETAQVRAYPFQPHLWAGLRAGDEVLLGHPRKPRTVGVGVVEELVRVPSEFVPLNVLPFKESPSHRSLRARPHRLGKLSRALWWRR